MSVISSTDFVNSEGDKFTTESITTLSTWFNESESTPPTPGEEMSIAGSVPNTIDVKHQFYTESLDTLSVFQAFIMIEIVMTALELIISIAAVVRIPRWRKNYRNQMLMQLSVVRFLKRLVFLFVYLKDNKVITDSFALDTTLISCEFYVDFVIVMLVFFFIRHMYHTLILVLVKVNQNNLYKVLALAWILPLPITVVCSAIIATEAMDVWTVYLLMCSIFRWPLILIGTLLYLTIVYRVLKDKIRKFARSLAIITFLLCLVINFYLFSRDVIELWCLKSFATMLTSSILGFLLNFLILCLYITLITLNFKYNSKSSDKFPNNVSIGMECHM